MPRYLLLRSAYSLLVLWGVATLVFFLFQALPADQARQPGGPVGTRYLQYLNDLSPIGVTHTHKRAEAPDGIHLTRLGDSSFVSLKAPFAGRSFQGNRNVGAVLGEGLPGTILLALGAMLIAVVLGIALGVLGALKKDTAFDTGAIAASVAGLSIPVFFAALVIAYVFGHLLGAITGLDMTGSLYEYDAISGRRPALRNLILPAITLSIRPMAVIIQLTRSAMLDVLDRDFIRAAYAKGLSRTHVVLRHALPNALIPLAASGSAWLPGLLTGSFFVEFLFGWKGIGTITVDALERLDFPLVTGAVLLTALILIVMNLISDILYRLIDPRVRA